MAKKGTRSSRVLKKFFRLLSMFVCAFLVLFFIMFCFQWNAVPHEQITLWSVFEATVSVIATGVRVVVFIIILLLISAFL